MKKRGLIGRVVSTALVTAMVMTMGGMSAFADTTTEPIATIPLTKNVVASPSNIQAPNTSFDFEISIPAEDGTITDATGKTFPVYKGIVGGVAFDKEGAQTATITFAPNDVLTKTINVLPNEAAFNAPEKVKPGIYRYIITEIEPTEKYDGMSYSEAVYHLDLYVINGTNGNEIEATRLYLVGDTTEKKDVVVFDNNYSTNNLIVKKVITGNQADMTAKFDFEITISGAEGEKYTSNHKDQDGNAIIFENGVAKTISLGHNEAIEIFGLSPADTYSVKEIDVEAGYTTTIDGADTEDEALRQASGKADTDTDTVVFTNTKSVSTPTGIILSFAPYILMVALAGVFAFLFLRKKRDEF